jgi:hypothetical protein
MKPAPLSPNLEDLLDELKRGRVYACSLHDRKYILDGFTDGTTIWIDARVSVIDTLIHELLHRLKPRWSERTVRRHTGKILEQIDDTTMRRVWRAYQRVVKRRRPYRVEEEDE